MSAAMQRPPRAALISALFSALMPASMLMLMLTAACLPARSQNLVDPTQPPPEARLSASGVEAAVAATSGPQLQSVLIGTRGREVAVIDGQLLRKGDKINGAQLVRISKNQVVLQHGRERRVLTLFPDTGTEGKTSAQPRALTK